MIQERTTYTILCDNCGADSCDGTEYSSWGDIQQAEDDAEESNRDTKKYISQEIA